MSRDRIILQVAAGFGALVAALGFTVWIGDHDFRGGSLTVGAGIAASQVGAAAGWPLIVRWLRSGWIAPLGIGLLMAVVVHLALGVLWMLVATLGKSGGAPSLGDMVGVVAFISFYSAVFVGWITAPVAMVVAVWVNRLRRAELVGGGVA